MKDTLITMMITLMPLMKPLMWLGVAIAAAGLVMLVAMFAFGAEMKRGVTIASRVVLGTAIFFLVAQLMGSLLNMPPTINFGDAEKFEFVLVSFWQIGAGLFIAGLLILSAKALKKE